MAVLDKIKSFFKRPKPEAKGVEKKAAEHLETKATEAPKKKTDGKLKVRRAGRPAKGNRGPRV